MCPHDASEVPDSVAWPKMDRRRDEIDHKIDDGADDGAGMMVGVPTLKKHTADVAPDTESITRSHEIQDGSLTAECTGSSWSQKQLIGSINDDDSMLLQKKHKGCS